MAEVNRTRDYDIGADELWALIGDFHGVHKWVPGTTTESIDGGKARLLKMGPNEITERLADEGERSYTYTMDDGGPLPVVNYRSTISVSEAGENKSTVSWSATFEPAEGGTEEQAVQILNMVYDGGLDGLAKTLAG